MTLSASEVICPTCGSVYVRTDVAVDFRDKDTFECLVCDERLASWNGQIVPRFKLVQRGVKPGEETDTPPWSQD
jgi:hypothetical protein